MQVNMKFRKLFTSFLSDIILTRTKIRVLKRSLPTLIMVRDVSDPAVRKLGVDALPVVVGWLSNGEKHTLKTRISVKDIKLAVEDLSALLDGFEKRNKKAASSQAKNPHSEAGDKQIPLVTPFNFDALCGDTAPVCIIGAFRSSKARGKLETILSSVSNLGLTEIIIQMTEFGLQFWGCHRLCSFRCFQASIIFEFIRQIWIQITRQARGGLQTPKGEVCSLCWGDLNRGSGVVYWFSP